SAGAMQDVQPSTLYALARTLSLRDPGAIAARATEDLVAALKSAVPALIADPGVAFDVLVAQLKRQAATAALNTPASAEAGTLAQILAPHLPNPADQAALLTAFADHAGTPAQFWADYAVAHP